MGASTTPHVKWGRTLVRPHLRLNRLFSFDQADIFDPGGGLHGWHDQAEPVLVQRDQAIGASAYVSQRHGDLVAVAGGEQQRGGVGVELGLVEPEADWRTFPLWPDAYYLAAIDRGEFDRLAHEIADEVFRRNEGLLGKIRQNLPLLRRNPRAAARKLARRISASRDDA